MDETVHIAGSDVTIDDRYLRQRCAWCGQILVDYDLENVKVPNGSGPSRPSVWPHGSLVMRRGGASWIVEPLPGNRVPETACTAAVGGGKSQ